MTFSKKLVIVESPTKCKMIEEYLGSEYKVIACFGHVRDIYSLTDIQVHSDFNAKYTVYNNKKALVDKIQKEIDTAYEVMLATDDDREGEAIAWHICDLYDLPIENTKRILFHEITKDAILKAFQNPTIINMNKVYSQKARQILDMMIGYTVTPYLWKNIINDTTLSAGRCQTPTLQLIYENHLKATTAKNKPVYTIHGYFTNKHIAFVLDHHYQTKEQVLTFLEYTCLHQHHITSSIINRTKSPPSPLTTSLILQQSPYSAADTMKICQQLYEDGMITYMRTDTSSYNTSFLSFIKKWIMREYSERYIGEIQPCDSSAHEAIRPTDISRKQLPFVYGTKERKIYHLIWETTLESVMPPAEYEEQTICISAPFELKYIKKTENIIFDGWYSIKKRKSCMDHSYFTHCKMNILIPYKKITCNIAIHNSCPLFTESDLICKLEKHGIGRPSTYHSLIQKIQDRKYVEKKTVTYQPIDIVNYKMENDIISQVPAKYIQEKEHNKLVLLPLGIKVIEYLQCHFMELFDYEYTRTMETQLDHILEGRISHIEVCSSVYNKLGKLTEPFNARSNNEHEPEPLSSNQHSSSILRTVNQDISIRTNKKGEPYIFYKTAKMHRPHFFPVVENYMNCDKDIIIQYISKEL